MITTFYPPYHFGGDGTFVRALSMGLANMGHHVTVIHCEDAFRLKQREERKPKDTHENIRIIRLRHALGPVSPLITQQFGVAGLKYRALKNILDEHFDVVNFHNISLIGGPSILGMSKALVTLYTLHEHWLVCPTHILWKFGRKACDGKQCIRCCLSSGIPPQLRRYGSGIERGLANVDLMLAPSRFTLEKHAHLSSFTDLSVLPLFSNLSDAEKTRDEVVPKQFLTVGRVTRSKGISDLVASFSRWPAYRLVVAGDGDELAFLRKKYANCENITFIGSVAQNELTRFYRKSVAVILPSLAPETFGLTVVEAFSCGVPAIVRRAGGNTEVIERYGGGYIYDEPAELKRFLELLVGTPGLRYQLGKQGRDACEQEFSREVYLRRYLNIIMEIAERKGFNLEETLTSGGVH